MGLLDYINEYYIGTKMFSMPITEGFFWLFCILTFYPVKRNLKSVLIALLQFFVIWPVFIVLKWLVRNTGFNVTYIYLIACAIYAAAAGFRTPVNTLIRFCTYSTAYVFGTAFGKAAGGVVYLNILHAEYTLTTGYIFIAVLVPLVLFTHFLLMKLFPLEKHEQVGAVWLIPPLIVAIFSNIAKILVDVIKGDELPFFGLEEQQSSLLIFLLGLVLYLFNVLSYMLCFRQSAELERKKRTEAKISVLESESTNTQDTALIFKNSMEEMRSIRHDIKNQLAYLQIMMDSKDYAGMEEYFRELNKNVSGVLNVSDCENITVRNVLNLENYRAKQSGVRIDSRITIPSKLGIADIDLTTVLMNLLDNAIEACIEDGCIDPVIECNMRQQGRYLFINVKNPVADKSKHASRLSLRTTKPEKELHGRGTKIVAAIASKYEGAFSHKIEGDCFIADVMLYNTWGEDGNN